MAVGFDAVGPSGGGGFDSIGPAASGTVTWTHTCGASATALIVAFQTDSTSTGTPTVTAKYNSVSMTALGNANVGGIGYCFLFGLLNPTTGSALTVSVTYSVAPTLATLVGGSASFTGAGGFGSFINGGTVNKNITITSTTSGNLSLGVFNAGSSITGEPTTNRWLNVVQGSNGSDLGNQAASTVPSSTGSTSIASWTTSATTFLSVGVEVQVPAGSTSTPKPIVVSRLPRRKGQVVYRPTPPVFKAPNGEPIVRTFVRRAKGSAHLLTFPPVFTAPNREPIVRTFTRRSKGQSILLRMPPLSNPHTPPPIVRTFRRRSRGFAIVIAAPPLANPYTPAPIVRSFSRRSRGHVSLLTFPPVFTAPTQRPSIHTFVRRSRGFAHLQTFPPPLFVPTQQPIVRSFTRRHRGQHHLQTFTPQQGLATPKPIVCTFRRRSKGTVQVLRRPPLFTPPTQRPVVHTFLRRSRGVAHLQSFPPIIQSFPGTVTISDVADLVTVRDSLDSAVAILDRPFVADGWGEQEWGESYWGQTQDQPPWLVIASEEDTNVSISSEIDTEVQINDGEG